MIPAKDVLFLTLTGTANSVCRIIEPLLLGYFVASLLSSELQYTYRLYGCASAMFLTSFTRNLCAHQFAYRGDVWGIRISSALRGLIYTKVSYQKLIYINGNITLKYNNIKFLHLEETRQKSELQMGFEPTALRDLVGCSNY